MHDRRRNNISFVIAPPSCCAKSQHPENPAPHTTPSLLPPFVIATSSRHCESSEAIQQVTPRCPRFGLFWIASHRWRGARNDEGAHSAVRNNDEGVNRPRHAARSRSIQRTLHPTPPRHCYPPSSLRPPPVIASPLRHCESPLVIPAKAGIQNQPDQRQSGKTPLLGIYRLPLFNMANPQSRRQHRPQCPLHGLQNQAFQWWWP